MILEFQRLVELPDDSSEIVDETEMEKFQKKVVNDVQLMFADLQKIEVENPESTLSSKPDFE
ncbi:MAG TPA: hypothetical protein VKA95_03575 [Nitrososphaeraceae archaeon]|jgi:hypothetical protein|nr:hypothetical protein [Nitrososphaeraceae archaeon]